MIDRTRFTSAGGVGSLDMMLEIITKDYGAELAAGVAEWFVHSPLRSSVDRKMMPLRLRQASERAGSLGHRHHGGRCGGAAGHVRLAGRLHSPDRLERSFGAELGFPQWILPATQVETRRRPAFPLDAARARRCEACGFASMSSFARAFREENGHQPTQARRR